VADGSAATRRTIILAVRKITKYAILPSPQAPAGAGRGGRFGHDGGDLSMNKSAHRRRTAVSL
jgi:hypothetical protein